jgi:hypothetical protein
MNLLILALGFIFSPNMLYVNLNKRRVYDIQLDTNITKLHNSLVPPSGGELKLLFPVSTQNWVHEWIIYISNSNTHYDDHYYFDYFTMKGLANMYTSSEYFYLGFFPDSIITSQGPKYIGLFQLNHKARVFNTKCIIENPYYIEGESELSLFKDHIVKLTESAFVFFSYADLNSPGQVRYYLEWRLN